MKINACNVHMQALHRKLDVVLVQLLRYNCSETDYSFCEDSPPAVSPSDPFSPPSIFSLRRACQFPQSVMNAFHHVVLTVPFLTVRKAA